MSSIIRRNVDPDTLMPGLARIFAEFEADSLYLAEQRSELTRAYPDEWIAIHDGSVVAHAPEHQEVLDRLRTLNLNPGFTVTSFLNTRPTNLTLRCDSRLF